MNRYAELREKHQKEFDKFPMKFAFSDKQFKEAMESLGLTENDTDKIIGIGAGGFIRKSDLKAYTEMCQRTEKEMRPGYHFSRGILRLAEDFGIKKDMTSTV